MNRPHVILVTIIFLILLDVWLWQDVFATPAASGITALDVGQGDATLASFRSGATILTDTGPDTAILRALGSFLPNRNLDLVVLTHPQLDHYGGLRHLLGRYRIGAVLVNGRDAEIAAPGSSWHELMAELKKREIPVIILRGGDRIRIGSETMTFLGPDRNLIQSAELNDTGFVARLELGGFRTLLAADIDEAGETYLEKNLPPELLRAELLKVAHHGSKFSSSEAFLRAVAPKAALIEVGKGNRFGHPTPEALRRLEAVGAAVFRTDRHGTVNVTRTKNETLSIRLAR
ncbi:MAG: MBL fold metallo-hydrolase [Patescibacteria group bacterium]